MKFPKISLRGLKRTPRYASKKYPEYGEYDQKRYLVGGEYLGDRRYYMRPHEFLSLVKPFDEDADKVIVRTKDIEGRPHFDQAKYIGKLSRKMQTGHTFEPLYVNYDKAKNVITGHEGRHRALAAIDAGIKYVPVDVIIYDDPGGAFDKTKARREGSDAKVIKMLRAVNEKLPEDEIVDRPGAIKSWKGAPKITHIPSFTGSPNNIYTEYGAIGKIMQKSNEDEAFIHSIDIDKKEQRKGYGTQVIGKMFDKTNEIGVLPVPSSKRFWASVGAEETAGPELIITRESFEASQIAGKPLGEPGPLNPECDNDLCYRYVSRNRKPGDKILMQGISTDDASSEGHFAIKREGKVMEFMPGEGERIIDEDKYSQGGIVGAKNIFREIDEQEFNQRVSNTAKPLLPELVSEPSDEELSFAEIREPAYSLESPLEKKVKKPDREPEEEATEYSGDEAEQDEELKSLYGD